MRYRVTIGPRASDYERLADAVRDARRYVELTGERTSVHCACPTHAGGALVVFAGGAS